MRKPCKKEKCIWCEEDFDCIFWHSSTQHNEPPLFGEQIDKAENEFEYHLWYLWEHIKALLKGEENNPLQGTNQRDLIAIAHNRKKLSDSKKI